MKKLETTIPEWLNITKCYEYIYNSVPLEKDSMGKYLPLNLTRPPWPRYVCIQMHND